MNGIQSIAAKGRHGDNTLMHVSDGEVAGLNALARSMMGRELTRNPDTGLPEAFLFAPLLAPALMGAAGGALGTGALATGLVAGGLGAAEAAARGMDDPLQQGLMAGLTAGAGSAIGSSLQGANDAAVAAAGGAPLSGAEMDVLTQSGNIVTPGVPGYTPPPSIAMPTSTPTGLPPGGTSMLSAAPPTTPPVSPMPSSDPYAKLGITPGPSSTVDVNAQMLAQENMLQAGDDILQGARMGGDDYSGMFGGARKSLAGAKAIATGAPGAPTMGEFIQQNKMPLAIGAAGLSGQQQLGAQQGMREKKEEMDAKKAAKLKATQDTIRRNYANVGTALPINPYTGRPVFAGGGIVNLMGGGRPFDSAPRYLETGGMLGDGMSDDIPAMIDGDQPAALSDGEFVIPADVVSHLGNGSSDAGAQQLYSMMDRIRQARTGNKKQGKEINPKKYMPA